LDASIARDSLYLYGGVDLSYKKFCLHI
jgi:hypothetical protein